jgi:hypothetical protein
MRSFRSLIAQTPALVISMLAVALSLGGGAYASTVAVGSGHGVSHPGNAPAVTRVVQADSQAATASGVSWTTLSLVNGWTSEKPRRPDRQPQGGHPERYRLPVRVAGPAHPGQRHIRHPAVVVPANPQPLHHRLHVYRHPGEPLHRHDGTMEAFSSGTCGSRTNAQCFTSLATVSYPINS